jgi:hypothetical protein
MGIQSGSIRATLATATIASALAVVALFSCAAGAAGAASAPSAPGAVSAQPGGSPALAQPGEGLAPGATGALTCASSKQRQLAARLSRGLARALGGRHSVIGLAVADPALGLSCTMHQHWQFDAASAIKATILSALLLKEGGPGRLTAAQRNLARLMITQSDNNAATALWNEVGTTAMQRFLDRTGMRHTVLAYAWGLSQLTAQDELILLRVLANPGRVLSTASRRYALRLMAEVIPSQRWGVPAGAPRGVTVSVKNGWLPDPQTGAWHVNSIGSFSGKGISYQIAILTSGNPSEGYGIDTIQAAARVINRDLAQGR